jgi:hypothetical protein
MFGAVVDQGQSQGNKGVDTSGGKTAEYDLK